MIKLLKVRNYKSLRGEIKIPLYPLTVLVGPNASGKSNILDCLNFLAQFSASPTQALSARGGFSELVWGGMADETISIGIDGVLSSALGQGEFSYSITLKGGPGVPGIVIEDESLSVEGKPVFQRQGQGVQSFEGDKSVKEGLPGEASALRQLGRPQWPNIEACYKFVAGWKFYEFNPKLMAQPQQVRKDMAVSPDGSNVATVLHWLFSQEPEIFDKVQELLQTAMPEVEKLLSLLTEDGRTYIALREKHLPKRIPSWALSEGTVRLVAILLLLTLPTPPTLVALETPDSQLHPGLMEYLVDVLNIGAKQTQLVITTHNPFLLNCLPPESLLLISKEAGETRVQRASTAKGLKVALRSLGLGELWISQFFEQRSGKRR